MSKRLSLSESRLFCLLSLIVDLRSGLMMYWFNVQQCNECNKSGVTERSAPKFWCISCRFSVCWCLYACLLFHLKFSSNCFFYFFIFHFPLNHLPSFIFTAMVFDIMFHGGLDCVVKIYQYIHWHVGAICYHIFTETLNLLTKSSHSPHWKLVFTHFFVFFLLKAPASKASSFHLERERSLFISPLFVLLFISQRSRRTLSKRHWHKSAF